MEAAQTINVTEGASQPANRPVDKIRIGNVVASIWRTTTQKGDSYTVTFERHFKDEAGTKKTNQSFPRGDLLELAKAADKAYDAITDMQRKNLG